MDVKKTYCANNSVIYTYKVLEDRVCLSKAASKVPSFIHPRAKVGKLTRPNTT